MDIPTTPPTHPRMRSSIACARCRRSKIKCVNNGVDTTCRACEATGRECVYPTPGVGAGTVKREGDNSEKAEVKKQRTRKSEGITSDRGIRAGMAASKDNAISLKEALDPKILTQSVWQEAFRLFQLHFSTDLPFLHGPTFLNPVRAGITLSSSTTSTSLPSEVEKKLPGNEMRLLGILALTARFHPHLIAFHCSSADKPDPIFASEYYATALRASLVGEGGEYIGQPNLEKVQALLMLGLHDWGICRGARAWIHVGLAIRMAQALGLQFEDDLDDEPWALSSAMRIEADHLGVRPDPGCPSNPTSSEAFIDEEIKRRTFWSCFIMDQYLSSGKYRRAMLRTDEIRIQMPSSDNAFAFGERVCTSLINGDCSGASPRFRKRARIFSASKRQNLSKSYDDSNFRTDDADYSHRDQTEQDDEPDIACEAAEKESILSRFVRMVEIWGTIAQWSCSGGRRTEKHSPWHPHSKFYQLRQSLNMFSETMPRPFRLTHSNTQAHLTQGTSSTFTLIHTLYSLCLIILHREYVPFVPIRCERPEGPLDNPPDHQDMPDGFWADSARQLFKAARDIMDLVQACQSRLMLVETPILGFGLYTVAFVGVYAMNFPHMDVNGYMSTRPTGTDLNKSANVNEVANKALEMIGLMRPRLPMAANWFRTIKKVLQYYKRIIDDYKRNTQALTDGGLVNNIGSQKMRKQLSLRQGGLGGGVEGYKLLEKTLKEFGNLEDEDMETLIHEGTRQEPRGSFRDSSSGDPVPKTEGRTSENWTAINGMERNYNALMKRTDVTPEEAYSKFSDKEYNTRYANEVHPQSPIYPQARFVVPSPNPPPLVSPGSNTISTPSISTSPYPTAQTFSDSLNQQHATQSSSVQQVHAHSYSQPPPPPPFFGQKSYTGLSMHTSPNSNIMAMAPDHAAQLPTNWNPEVHEIWLNSLKTRLGGEDVAAFQEGSDWEESVLAGDGQGGSGWLHEVWR